MMTAALTSNSYVLVITKKVEPSTIFNIDEAITEAYLIRSSTSQKEREEQINTLREMHITQEVETVKLS